MPYRDIATGSPAAQLTARARPQMDRTAHRSISTLGGSWIDEDRATGHSSVPLPMVGLVVAPAAPVDRQLFLSGPSEAVAEVCSCLWGAVVVALL